MLKIVAIKPFGAAATVPIASITADFLRRIQRDNDPKTKLEELIATPIINIGGVATNLSANDLTALNYINDNFDSIITGTPGQLQGHIAAIDNSLFGGMIAGNFGQRFTQTLLGKAVSEIFGYEKYFRTKGRKGIWLARQLNIKTCPYCNSQYTLTVPKGTAGFLAKFQFDHFFSKKRFPYLSISLYNLIPSCAPCNLSKGDKLTNLTDYYHPYHSNMAYRSAFKAIYPINLAKLSIGNIAKLDLTTKLTARYPQFNDFVKRHIELFHIDACYNRHQDIVQELLVKAILYNSSFKDDVEKIRGLFAGDKSLFLRYKLGNYAVAEEMLDRPLAKFMQDIAKQFKIL